MNKIIKTITAFVILLVLIVLLLNTFIDNQALAVILSSLLSVVFTLLANEISNHGYGIKLWLQSKFKFRNKDVRISFSYLFRIKVDGKYLFIRGGRLKNQFQPVGGVYKFYNEAKPFLESIHYNIDQRMNNEEDDDDLRLELKGKYIFEFLDWFNNMHDREYDPLREFREELFNTGILSEKDFGEISYRKVSTHDVGIEKSQYNKCWEYVYADIFEIKLNERQEDILRGLQHKPHPDICWADSDETKRMCVGGIEKNLGNNAPWILGEEK